MAKTFKALSALLCYPGEELQGAIAEIGAVLDEEALVPADCRRGLSTLMAELAHRDIYDLQERYVLLFDRTRSLSLHLFEHVHGESRDRGAAMVDLQQVYEKQGLANDSSELPDFLPLFLEFLSMLPLDEARETLGQPLHIIAALGERLKRRDSAYASVLAALEAIAAEAPAAESVAEILKTPEDDPTDLAELDRVWEEAAVAFGPGPEGENGCPKASDMVRRMQGTGPETVLESD